MKTSLHLLCLLLIGGQVSATHLRGGYISARNTTALSYEVTATIYYEGSASAGVEGTITLCFGDGTTQEVTRQSQRTTTDGSLSISTYRTIHTYAGPGTYVLTTGLSNRSVTRNIAGATDQIPMALSTTLSTNNGLNQTPLLAIPATGFQIATNQRLIFPMKATDAEGDSVAYTLARPLTNTTSNTCLSRTVTGYRFPNDLTQRGIFKVGGRTGDLTWDAPVELGNYSVAIQISEYRNGLLISQTLTEFLLTVVDKPGTPGVIPPYEPALEGGIVTALPIYRDEDVSLTVSPNPVDDRLQVVIQTSNPTTAQTQLLDGSGRILHELSFGRSARQHEQVISMSSLTPGQYVLRANVDGRTLVRKVIKK